MANYLLASLELSQEPLVTVELFTTRVLLEFLLRYYGIPGVFLVLATLASALLENTHVAFE